MSEKIITFVKGEGKKFLNSESKLIPTILKDGWKEFKESEAVEKAEKKDDKKSK